MATETNIEMVYGSQYYLRMTHWEFLFLPHTYSYCLKLLIPKGAFIFFLFFILFVPFKGRREEDKYVFVYVHGCINSNGSFSGI